MAFAQLPYSERSGTLQTGFSELESISSRRSCWSGSVETFEEAYFEVKRHHEQPDEDRAQNGGSIQDLGSESAQAGFP
jgi:hypothetical protein